MSKTILITGLNGQLGQHLAKFFQESHPDFKIIGTVRHKSYDKQPKIYDESKIITETLDLTDSISVETVVKKYQPDYLFNTSANAFVGSSWILAEQHMSINCLGVLKILEAIKNHSPNTRFLNMGTSEEMGCTLEDTPNGSQDESTKISPKSPYACSKAAARYLIDTYRNSYNLRVVQPWTFNFESKLRGEKYVTRKITKGVARILRAIQNKESFEPIELGNLNSSRSWQHAADVAEGLWLVANQAGDPKDWKPYVLSENATHTVREFIEKCFAKVGIPAHWEGAGLQEEFVIDNYINEIGEIKSQVLVSVNPEFFRPHDVSYLFGNSNKIRQELGWSPKKTFEDLLTEMVEWDVNNP
jgi:GDPmannose 4,6-dehydratase